MGTAGIVESKESNCDPDDVWLALPGPRKQPLTVNKYMLFLARRSIITARRAPPRTLQVDMLLQKSCSFIEGRVATACIIRIIDFSKSNPNVILVATLNQILEAGNCD